jgi:hypothetical protein
MYPFIVLAIHAVGWSRTWAFYHSPGTEPCALYRKLGGPMVRTYSYGEEKKLFSRTVFIPQMV